MDEIQINNLYLDGGCLRYISQFKKTHKMSSVPIIQTPNIDDIPVQIQSKYGRSSSDDDDQRNNKGLRNRFRPQLKHNTHSSDQPASKYKSPASALTDWGQVFRAQNIQTLVLKRMIYSHVLFEDFSEGLLNSLVKLELKIAFPIMMESYLPHESESMSIAGYTSPVEHASSGSGGITFHKHHKKKPIKKLFQLLQNCHKLRYLSLDFIQHPNQKLLKNANRQRFHNQSPSSSGTLGNEYAGGNRYSQSRSQSHSHVLIEHQSQFHDENDINDALMEPLLGVSWIYSFLRSKHISRTIEKFDVQFNEMSTDKFEKTYKNLPKFRKHGDGILRINEDFTRKLEKVITELLAECENLSEIRMIRTYSSVLVNDEFVNHLSSYPRDEFSDEHTTVQFEDQSCFALSNPLLADVRNTSHKRVENMVLYQINKRRRSNGGGYAGEINGDLERILQPECPIF